MSDSLSRHAPRWPALWLKKDHGLLDVTGEPEPPHWQQGPPETATAAQAGQKRSESYGPLRRDPCGRRWRRTLLKRAGPDSHPLPDHLLLGSRVLTLVVHCGPTSIIYSWPLCVPTHDLQTSWEHELLLLCHPVSPAPAEAAGALHQRDPNTAHGCWYGSPACTSSGPVPLSENTIHSSVFHSSWSLSLPMLLQ